MTARDKGEQNLQALRSYFEAHPFNWYSTKALCALTGQHQNSIAVHCRHLIRLGYLEEKLIYVKYANARNGRQVIHYRHHY